VEEKERQKVAKKNEGENSKRERGERRGKEKEMK
jgi:hypothetical protein